MSAPLRLREVWVFYLEKRRFWGHLRAAFHYLKGTYRRTGGGIFTRERCIVYKEEWL